MASSSSSTTALLSVMRGEVATDRTPALFTTTGLVTNVSVNVDAPPGHDEARSVIQRGTRSAGTRRIEGSHAAYVVSTREHSPASFGPISTPPPLTKGLAFFRAGLTRPTVERAPVSPTSAVPPHPDRLTSGKGDISCTGVDVLAPWRRRQNRLDSSVSISLSRSDRGAEFEARAPVREVAPLLRNASQDSSPGGAPVPPLAG